MLSQRGCDEGNNMMTRDRAASRGTAAKRIISKTLFN